MIRMRHMMINTVVMALVLCAMLVPGFTSARCEGGEKGTPTLTGAGMALEKARLLPHEAKNKALHSAAASVASILDAGLPKERQSAAWFLSAEINFALGHYEDAVREYGKAGDKDREKIYRDDAAAAHIMALEASGKDEEAARAWKKWFDRYYDSPLVPEAMLACAWNALRRGDISGASKELDDLESRHQWMESDRRTVLARSLIRYGGGDHAGAFTALESLEDSPEVIYLRALCREAAGETLRAAAGYQEVSERWPHSPLRDSAMIAKADIFLHARAYTSAAEEMARVVRESRRGDIRREASLRQAVAVFLDGGTERAVELLKEVTVACAGTEVAARAQFLLGESLFGTGAYQEAIVEFNGVLSEYFEHDLAARAQYRIGQSLDALGRGAEATSSYQAAVAGYPLSPESPAAAYLAGVGLLDMGSPLVAAPYFQLVIDRYARSDSSGMFIFATDEHQELVEASLCLLEYSYHRAGDLGQLSGAPHLMLQRMPPSDSPWRAYSVLIDADALASQARYDEAEAMLTGLIEKFSSHAAVVPASRLLAWTYARQGRDELAMKTEERMLARYASSGDDEYLGSAYFNKANILFNRKEYGEAAESYDDFLRRFPENDKHFQALYRAGLCYQRLDHNGDAVDRWEALVAEDSTSTLAEKALVRAGDMYFRAGHYEDARRCYGALLQRFISSDKAPLAMLRLAQSEYNSGGDEEALTLYSKVIERFPDSYAEREAERGIEQALYRLGQRDDGTEVLVRLVEQHGTSPFAADAQFEIAMRSYKVEDYEESAEQFRRVTSQFPAYSAADRAHYLMAESYRKAGKTRESRLACEQFVNFFPHSEFRPTVHFRLGSLRFEEGKYMQAAVDFTGVLDEGAPDEIMAAALYNLALCRRMLGETAAATENLEKYRETYPSGNGRTADVAYQLGDIHEEQGRPEKAIKEFERALSAKPPKPMSIELRYHIGVCREELGEDAAAIAVYEKAISRGGKNDPFRLLALARCAGLYEDKESWDRAITIYKDLIRNSQDEELVLAAGERVAQLEAIAR
ncbi:MAG: tetratricopeptide repeat protein [Candidatus Krumholzibacteria bacterium]|nr:tetratricopeptide repeat protein [Candidatus Krumholzibacteria bacterium]